MKKTLALLLVLAMVFALAACGNTKTGLAKPEQQQEKQKESTGTQDVPAPQEVVFWHSLSGAAGDEIQAIVDEYNAGQGAEKGILVNAVYQGYQGTDKVILAYQTNDTENACDINIGLTSTIPSMLDLDWTVKASDLMEKYDSSISVEDFHPAMARSVTYMDEMVAIPFLNSTMLLYYNVDALKEAGIENPPATMDQMIQDIVALTKKDANGNITQYGLECQVKRYHLVQFLVSQNERAFFCDMEGGRVGAPTKLTCDEDGTLAAFLDKWDEVIATGGYQYLENNVSEDFSTGLAAMVMMSSSKCGSVFELVGDSFEWRTAPIPSVNESDTSGAAVGGSCLVMFNRGDDKRVEAAWDFVQYLCTADVQTRITAVTGYIPTVKSAEGTTALNEFYSANPQYATAFEVIKTSSATAQEPMDLCYNEINGTITDIMVQYCEGSLTKDQAYSELISQCNKLLDEWHDANS